MPLYVADYLADTGHLGALESGGYLHLIMHYWLNGGLPSDDRQLARIARMTEQEWTASRDVIRAFFSNGWRHPRIEKELSKVKKIAASNSAKAKEAAAQRWAKHRENVQDAPDGDAPSNAPSTTQAQPILPPSTAPECTLHTSHSHPHLHSHPNEGLVEKGGGVNVKKGEKPPRHGALSRDKKFIYFEKGTPEFEAYAADYREAKGCDPDVNASGGRWFDMLGQFLQKGTC